MYSVYFKAKLSICIIHGAGNALYSIAYTVTIFKSEIAETFKLVLHLEKNNKRYIHLSCQLKLARSAETYKLVLHLEKQ